MCLTSRSWVFKVGLSFIGYKRPFPTPIPDGNLQGLNPPFPIRIADGGFQPNKGGGPNLETKLVSKLGTCQSWNPFYLNLPNSSLKPMFPNESGLHNIFHMWCPIWVQVGERQGKARYMLRDTYQLAPKRPLRSLKLMVVCGSLCPWIPSKRSSLPPFFSSLLFSYANIILLCFRSCRLPFAYALRFPSSLYLRRFCWVSFLP
jgi:hypothetical protein